MKNYRCWRKTDQAGVDEDGYLPCWQNTSEESLTRQEGHPACKKVSCRFDGGDDLTGALHVL